MDEKTLLDIGIIVGMSLPFWGLATMLGVEERGKYRAQKPGEFGAVYAMKALVYYGSVAPRILVQGVIVFSSLTATRLVWLFKRKGENGT